MLQLIRVLVNAPIHLYRQPCRRAVKVDDIGTNRMLPPKLEAVQPMSAHSGP
jgi:hypothetical protein